ncbi:Uncharacterised protein [Lelliottia amnigena]|nr:Uncharacterised protein [Lelliottia amnigena]
MESGLCSEHSILIHHESFKYLVCIYFFELHITPQP